MNEKYWLFVKQLMKNINYKECKPCKFVEANKKFINSKYAEHWKSVKIKDINTDDKQNINEQ